MPDPLHTTLSSAHTTVESWCKAVRGQLPDSSKWFAMPHNRFDSAESTWWLSSIGKNPAYEAAKVTFHRSDDGLVVGLVAEKGIAEAYRGAHPNPTEVMTSSWAWHRTMKAIGTAEFDQLLHRLADHGEVELALDSGVPSRGAVWDRIRYRWNRAEFVRQSPSSGGLDHFPETLTLHDLPGLVTAIPNVDWRWVDLYIRLRVQEVPSSTPTTADRHLVETVVGPLADRARRLTGSTRRR